MKFFELRSASFRNTLLNFQKYFLGTLTLQNIFKRLLLSMQIIENGKISLYQQVLAICFRVRCLFAFQEETAALELIFIRCNSLPREKHFTVNLSGLHIALKSCHVPNKKIMRKNMISQACNYEYEVCKAHIQPDNPTFL